MDSYWSTRLAKTGRDLSVVCGMWWNPNWDDPTEKPDLEKFKAIVDKNPTQIMLAVTAPESGQKAAWAGLEASGFEQLATGLRTPGHHNGRHLFLWGRRVDCALHTSAGRFIDFNSCGVDGYKYTKTSIAFEKGRDRSIYNNVTRKYLTVHYVPVACKLQIPKHFKLIATTKLAKIYLENARRIFKTLDL